MNLTTEAKQKLFKKYGEKETNTGSTQGQIALFTARINHLTKHLKINNKNFLQKEYRASTGSSGHENRT